jgi:hypothetical protein
MGGRALRVWASLGGVLFVVLAVIGSILLFDGPTDSSPLKMAAYYGKSSHRNETHLGWVLTGLGLFCLVWFVAAVRERVVASERASSGEGTLLSTVVLVGGSVYIALALATVAVTDGIKTMSDDTYHHQVYSGIIHAASDAGYMLVVTGAAGMAALIFAVSAAVLGLGILPRWIGWFGIVAGIAAIFSLFFFTMLLWLLWVAVASVALFLRSRAEVATPATALAS